MKVDIDKALNVPFVLVLAKKTYEFPKLSIVEIGTLAARIKANNIAEIKKLCEDCGITGIEKLKAIKQAQDTAATVNSVWSYAFSIDGASEIVKLSLKNKPKEEVDQIIAEVGPELLCDVACFVSGHHLNEVKPEPTKEDEKDAAQKKMIEEAVGFPANMK